MFGSSKERDATLEHPTAEQTAARRVDTLVMVADPPTSSCSSRLSRACWACCAASAFCSARATLTLKACNIAIVSMLCKVWQQSVSQSANRAIRRLDFGRAFRNGMLTCSCRRVWCFCWGSSYRAGVYVCACADRDAAMRGDGTPAGGCGGGGVVVRRARRQPSRPRYAHDSIDRSGGGQRRSRRHKFASSILGGHSQ
jgi:hypothetical protein